MVILAALLISRVLATTTGYFVLEAFQPSVNEQTTPQGPYNTYVISTRGDHGLSWNEDQNGVFGVSLSSSASANKPGRQITLNRTATLTVRYHAVVNALSTWSPPVLHFDISSQSHSQASFAGSSGSAHGWCVPAPPSTTDMNSNAGGSVFNEGKDSPVTANTFTLGNSWTYSNGVWTSDSLTVGYSSAVPLMVAEANAQYNLGGSGSSSGTLVTGGFTMAAPPMTVTL